MASKYHKSGVILQIEETQIFDLQLNPYNMTGEVILKDMHFSIYLAQSLQNHAYSPCRERPPVLRDHIGEFPAQRPVTQSFDVFFDLRLNKRLSKTIVRLVIWDAIAPMMTSM